MLIVALLIVSNNLVEKKNAQTDSVYWLLLKYTRLLGTKIALKLVKAKVEQTHTLINVSIYEEKDKSPRGD